MKPVVCGERSRVRIALACLVAATTSWADVEVRLDPFLLQAEDAMTDARAPAVVGINLPLVRRVVLGVDDIHAASFEVRCEPIPQAISIVAEGAVKDASSVCSLTDEKSLRKIALHRGESLVLTGWKSSWHWNGGMTLEGGRIACGATSVAIPSPGQPLETELGTFSFVGLSRRDNLPVVRDVVAGTAEKGSIVIPSSRGAALSSVTQGLRFSTNGRASPDVAYDWVPALVFKPRRDGVYGLDGHLSFSVKGDRPEMRWLVGVLPEPAPPKDAEQDAILGFYPLRTPLSAGQRATLDDCAGRPLWKARIRKGRATVDKDVAEALRKWVSGEWPDAGVCVVAHTEDGQPVSVRLKGAKGSMSVVEHPKHLLFDAPVKIKPGVYAERRDGRLYYDGKRLRLWSQVKDGDGARFRQLGMNGWRAWFAGDFYTKESAARGEAMPTEKGDGSSLDRYDRMFASMKENDVFVMFATLIGLGMDLKAATADGSWLHALHGHEADWREWREAVLALGGDAHLASYFDDRLWEIRLRHAKNVLTHLNPYTGRRYAEDEAIVLVEINNEAMHVRKWSDQGFKKYPACFQRQIERAWKSALADDPDLTRQRFYMDLVDRRNREYIAYCRSFAPKGVGVNTVAFSCDSIYRASAPWLWTDAQGDSSTVSMYFWQNGSMLASPPGFYVLDSHRLDGKLNVIYETGRGRPSRFRAETPYSLAVLCDWQDFDIVDWHGSWSGDARPEEVLAWRAMPPATTHYWNGVHLEADPVMRSAIAMAGRLYLMGVIGSAENPAVYSLGRDAIYGRQAWNGVGGSDTSRRTFTRGTKIRFDPQQRENLLIDGMAPERVEPPTGPVRTGKFTTWDWQNERLIIDAPCAKVYVGKTCPSFAFSDGVTLSGVNVPWIAFSMIARDGKPLVESAKDAWISAVSDACNTDLDYDYSAPGGPLEQAKAVRNPGHAPVIVERVSCVVSFPRKVALSYTGYDFALRETHRQEQTEGGVLRLRPQDDWMGILRLGPRGGKTTPVVEPSPGARIRTIRTEDGTADERTDPKRIAYWCPLPDITWGDSYQRAHRALRDSGMGFDTISPKDDTKAKKKTIKLTSALLLRDLPATVELRYEDEWPRSIAAEFEQTPDYRELVAMLKKRLGAPKREKLTDQAFNQSEVEWLQSGDAGQMRVVLTETQGMVRLLLTF